MEFRGNKAMRALHFFFFGLCVLVGGCAPALPPPFPDAQFLLELPKHEAVSMLKQRPLPARLDFVLYALQRLGPARAVYQSSLVDPTCSITSYFQQRFAKADAQEMRSLLQIYPDLTGTCIQMRRREYREGLMARACALGSPVAATAAQVLNSDGTVTNTICAGE